MKIRVLAMLLVPAISLASCGGSKSDNDKITDLIKDVGKNPLTLCTKYATAALLQQVGGPAACETLTKQPGSKDPDVKVDTIAIKGKTATATVTGNRGRQRISLTKDGDDWKVDTVTAGQR